MCEAAQTLSVSLSYPAALLQSPFSMPTSCATHRQSAGAFMSNDAVRFRALLDQYGHLPVRQRHAPSTHQLAQGALW
jgi:hypothetical protein